MRVDWAPLSQRASVEGLGFMLPWKVWKVVVICFLYLPASWAVGTAFGIATVAVGYTRGWEAPSDVAVRVATVAAQITCAGTSLLITLYLIKRSGTPLKLLWRSYVPRQWWWSVASLVGGGALGSAWSGLASQLGSRGASQSDTHEWVVLTAEILSCGAVTAVFEELLYRGVLYQLLRQQRSAAMAMVLSAGIFAAGHVGSYVSVDYGFVTLLVGLISVFLLERSDSLTNCILLHFGVNAATWSWNSVGWTGGLGGF